MRRILVAMTLLAAACGTKTDTQGGAASGADPKAITCPPGSLAEAGACVAVVTPEKIAVVTAQQSRLDELATLLDQVEVVAAPVELLDGFRQTEQFKTLAAKSAQLRVADTVVATMDDAVKQLRALKASLGEASARLGNLKGELDRVMTESGTATLADVRAKVSTELRAAIEPLATSVQQTVRDALTPLATQLSDMGDLVIGACAMAKLSGGGDQLTTMCATAKDAFDKGRAFVEDFKGKPAALFTEVSTRLESELALLVDTAAKQAIDSAQTQVNAALRLPPTHAGSAGSAGSATP